MLSLLGTVEAKLDSVGSRLDPAVICSYISLPAKCSNGQ